MVQEQFLEVVDRDEAQRRFHAALRLEPLGEEVVALPEAWGRALATEVAAPIDVPGFDRSNYDGYAVRAADTFGSSELAPRALSILPGVVEPGEVPLQQIGPGQAIRIATGGMLPRGAGAVVMVEDTDEADGRLWVRRAVSPGFGVSFAGTDIARGEVVLRPGIVLSSRETALLAALGIDKIRVWRRPRVAILSTGNELIQPGEPLEPAKLYDSNAQILADAVRELGGEPVRCGIVRDDYDLLVGRLAEILVDSDLVLLSGGTSKGAGDISYRAVGAICRPGVIVHGVAIKPGKPLCLAAHEGKAVVILPGFPTSAIVTFHEFVSPLLCRLGGRRLPEEASRWARLAVQVNSEPGRTEYVLVRLVGSGDQWTAWPIGKGSGSVSAFSVAEGYITAERWEEILPAGEERKVRLLATQTRPPDLVAMGSHCVGLDYLLSVLDRRGMTGVLIPVGSTAGLAAARRGECDLAGIHLLDPATGRYNEPFLTPDLELIRGYRRLQGIVYRPGDPRFHGRSLAEILQTIKNDSSCLMVNRNQGSGTRVLIDRLLGGVQPPGYAVQPSTHHAVAAAVSQGRADWGVTIEWVAGQNKLGFIPLEEECYDFVVPKARWSRPAIQAFRQLLTEAEIHEGLRRFGFRAADSLGTG